MAGNQASETVNVWLDLDAPVVAHEFTFDNLWTSQDAVISWTATDGFGGIVSTWYELDGRARSASDCSH